MASAQPGDTFEREYGCTEQEWRGWMPSAVHGHLLHAAGARALRVQIGSGSLQLEWDVLPPRVIALMRMPRMRVVFRFEQVDAQARRAFLRAFDLRLQRGGG